MSERGSTIGTTGASRTGVPSGTAIHSKSKAPGELRFRFDTAWDFPTPVFEKLAEMFPTLCFRCVCFDEMSNFAGRGAFNGEPPFEYMEATDELFEAVYGYKPEWDYEPSDEGEAALIAD
jgi:hypothetical protein